MPVVEIGLLKYFTNFTGIVGQPELSDFSEVRGNSPR